MKTHICGFPRIGAARELKRSLEAYWSKTASELDLLTTARTLKLRHWAIQAQAGLDYVATGDFSFYDHMLDTACMLGCVPERFQDAWATPLDRSFRMARGDAARNLPAMEMTKWFNTNYHYIVPEIDGAHTCTPDAPATSQVVEDTRLALQHGYKPKPVIPGPITFLSLARGIGGISPWDIVSYVADAYANLIETLAPLCDWIQLDEPILCADVSPEARAAFPAVYERLVFGARQGKTPARLLLATYYGALDDNLDLALSSGCDGLHVDALRNANTLDVISTRLPAQLSLSAGVVEGRNIWKSDYEKAVSLLNIVIDRIGTDRLMVASNSSLLHVPVDLATEQHLAPELKEWMAFAVQKCAEIADIAYLAQEHSGSPSTEGVHLLERNAAARNARHTHHGTYDAAVRKRCACVSDAMQHRKSPYAERKKTQQWLGLPLLPTTTIGSFPQTSAIRAARKTFRQGAMSHAEYTEFLQAQIADVIRVQEELGLDVFVHGESERNDMVEYFGQQLNGFCFTSNAWVQSYGSRCVKPPIIYGDVSRPVPMTVPWASYAASLTDKPVKGMLTGPVTILCWSFVRDDLPHDAVCRQIALAIRDEVQDLETAGIRIIQVDEAAFSEGMPLKERDRAEYLTWAAASFRLATSGVQDITQVHTHMCYSEFNAILDAIAAMDADVISIESSRSDMALLQAFCDKAYPNDIGPGIYDIHSPRVPTQQEMEQLIERALACIPADRLWINPDCGLKTRAWPETLASLRNMMAAAHAVRARCSGEQ